MRGTITDRFDVSPYIDYCEVSELTNEVYNAILTRWPNIPEVEAKSLKVHIECDSDYDGLCEVRCIVTYYRLETDGEMSFRLESEKRLLEQERFMYERLKKKFEDE